MKMTRRKWIIATGVVGGGLVLGLRMRGGDGPPPGATVEGGWRANTWLQVTPDDRVLFHMPKLEMGQGVEHGLTTVVAEELYLAPERIELLQAQVAPEFESNLATSASRSMASMWPQLREAGACVRYLLVGAAAARWGVDAAGLKTEGGAVLDPASGKRATYGALVEAARGLPVPEPEQVTPRDPASYQWVGKPSKRLGNRARVTGQVRYGVDTRLPGMVHAAVRMCPRFGGEILSYDAADTRAFPGVLDVVQVDDATIAVLAEGWWQASQGAEALKIEWSAGPLVGLDSDRVRARQQEKLKGELSNIAEEGELEEGFAAATKRIEARYYTPLHPHHCMEPQNATAQLGEDGRLHVWVGTQAPVLLRFALKIATGLEEENIEVHCLPMGGGFGRRVYPEVGLQAALLAQKVGKPVKLIWSREDDLQHDRYRCESTHLLEAGLDGSGTVTAWRHDLCARGTLNTLMHWIMPKRFDRLLPTGLALDMGRRFGQMVMGGDNDPAGVTGSAFPYGFANHTINFIADDESAPDGFWRSVGFSHNVFPVECFIDEVAEAAGEDPVAFRQARLNGAPRVRKVLDLAVETARWGRAPEGRFQGVALCDYAIRTAFFTEEGAVVAHVVEVEVQDKKIEVKRVVCAVDCGLVVNPDNVAAQVESSIVWALSAALEDPVTLKDGAVAQSNFHDAPVLRMADCPEIEVVLVESDAPPGGIGEPAVPPLAPALANALHAATGRRFREIPFRLG